MKRLLGVTLLSLWLLSTPSPSLSSSLEDVGTLSFPTSGAPEAQAHFLRGVGILHSFGWKQAIAEFKAAQVLDPDFALAYWGESLCYNHPLIRERDLETPKAVLNRLAPTLAERLAKAGTDREQGFVLAVDALFFGAGVEVGSGSKHGRSGLWPSSTRCRYRFSSPHTST